jgi:hypothetical protein
MYRLFGTLGLFIVTVISISFLFPEDVNITIFTPEEVEAGQEFRVQVTVDKGQLSGFARFQQELPAGLEAFQVNSGNAADFTFEDNRIRIIWLRLPEDEELTFYYRVRVNERLKGYFNLAGNFSYIEENERKSVPIRPQLVAINPSPDVDPALIVDIENFGNMYTPDLTQQPTRRVVCIRETPDKSNPQEINVNLLVNKNDLKQFAKIEEYIPAGYTAIEGDTKDGIFTYDDGIAKFIWRNLPAEEHFIVSYKLIPMETENQEPLTQMAGQFSYYRDNQTNVVDIVEHDADLLSMTTPEINELVAVVQQELYASGTGDVAIKADEPEEEPEPPRTVDQPKQVETTEIKPPSEDVMEANRNDLLSPQTGVYYRVQLAAGHKPVDVDRYFRKFNLEKEVKKEQHQGWYKYSVGSFDIYKNARDYRVHVWNTTEIDDAFVSAYNNGHRITVQEALMISDHKWYK